MKADRVEVSRDEEKRQWLIRIQVGEEVIRRSSNESLNADEAALRLAAVQMADEEGYKVDPSQVVILS